MRRHLLSLTIVVLVIAPGLAVNAGGGIWMRSPDNFIEPGEVVEMVAYDSLPNYGYDPTQEYTLRLEIGNGSSAPLLVEAEAIEITDVDGPFWARHRIYVRFQVPFDLQPRGYYLSIVDEEGRPFNYVGGDLEVGKLGPLNWTYEWPFDEPLVADLPSSAKLWGPFGMDVRVADIRNGIYPEGSERYLLDPSVLEEPGVTIVPVTTTTAPTTSTTTTTAATAAPTTTAAPSTNTSAVATTTLAATNSIQNGFPLVAAIAAVLAMMVGAGGALLLAARRREVLVVLGRRPMTTPPPTDGGESLDYDISIDYQARH
jgi:hypothetical protein